MSKIRQNVPPVSEASIEVRATGDAKPYVIFTQLKERGPHLYAGWLEAADDEMAMVLAKEHYGRDQECVGIWAIERSHIQSSDGLYQAKPATSVAATKSGASSSLMPFCVFTQKRAGDVFVEVGSVNASSPAEALNAAQSTTPQASKAHCIWVAPRAEILETAPGELIWRTTDQTYRLARGYTRLVKEKWRQFRGEEALKAYEEDDLKEEF
ncbi:MAG TPA: hypothetical protein PK400_01380 [Phycisphaerales bacterium]|nr:hypothetical protein [Phycisphaerales bacterium]HRQ75144.1 hypothetical protein [Phycisphaerales bacterium]